jgi:hypothetical protein
MTNLRLLDLPEHVLQRVIYFLCPTASELTSGEFEATYGSERERLGESFLNGRHSLSAFLNKTKDPEELIPGQAARTPAESAALYNVVLSQNHINPQLDRPKQEPPVGASPGKAKDQIYLRHPNIVTLVALGSTCRLLREHVRPLIFRTLIIDLWVDEDLDPSWRRPGRSDALFELLKYNPKIINEDVKGVLFIHSKVDTSRVRSTKAADAISLCDHNVEMCKRRLEKWNRMISRCKNLRVLAFQCPGERRSGGIPLLS